MFARNFFYLQCFLFVKVVSPVGHRRIFFPTLTMAACTKKKFLAKRFAHAISARVHYRDLEHVYVTEFDCVAVLAML